MLRLKIDNGSGYVDYTPFLADGTLSVTDLINQPTTIDFVLSNVARNFVVPRRGAYVKIESLKYNKTLATGFITQEPEKQFIGVSSTAASGFLLGYNVAATSDDWLLNVHSIPFLPAMVNQTMGQILRLLAEALVPGFYSYDVDDGDIVPIFKYDPKKRWSEVAKEFADIIRYRYQVIDRTIYFKPYGDQSLGVSYDDTSSRNRKFYPDSLHTSVFGTPVVNDVIVVGDVEPHRIREDNFIGTGIDSDFVLRHTVYGGATNLLLEEKWDGNDFSKDLWEVQDPDFRFTLSGALNVTAGSGPVSLGTAYIKGNNGLELGGHLDIEHGEFDFTGITPSGGSTGIGIIGGIYNDSALTQATCEVGFYASGNILYPIVDGVKGSPLATVKYNKHYRLQTVISADSWSRYTKLYRTLAGDSFGGTELASEALVTFLIQEIDLDTPGTVTVFKHTESMVLSAFGLYAPINTTSLRAAVTFTQIAKPVQGSLLARSLYGPYGDQLPVRPENIGEEEHYLLGFGLQNQTATIGNSQEHDLLRFYDDTIPAVGSRIRLKTWEAGRAVSRVRDDASVNVEAVISGDDGVRSAIVTDLNPLPRTSEDCDEAAAVFIQDREETQFNGSYEFYDEFLDEFVRYAPRKVTPSGPVFPRTGRYFNLHSPMRGIVSQSFLVRSVKMVIESPIEERISFTIEFGPDLHVPKLLQKFLKVRDEVLLPKDLAERPLIQSMSDIGTSFLPDLVDVHVVELISGNAFNVNVGTSVSGSQTVEVRRVDSNWGVSDQNLILSTTDVEFQLDRTAIEQVWYFRIVDGTKTSRRTAVIRIVYPLIPDPPGGELNTRDWLKPEVHLTIPGDIRNVWGVEIRSCMDSPSGINKLRNSCGTLFGYWKINSRVGPFKGLTAGKFYGVLASSDSGGRITTYKTSDYGENWTIANDVHSNLSPTLESFDSESDGNFIYIATAQAVSAGVVRVAYSKFNIATEIYDKVDVLAINAGGATGVSPSVSIAKRYSASGTVIGILYQSSVSGGKQQAAYIETSDDGTTWTAPIAIGDPTKHCGVGRVIPNNTGRMHFILGDTSTAFGDISIQTLTASNVLNSPHIWFTGGGLSQVQTNHIVGDYCTFTQGGILKLAVPFRTLNDARYAIFKSVDDVTAADVSQIVTGGTTYLSADHAVCPQLSLKWDGAALHAVGKHFTTSSNTYAWHKETTSSSLDTWDPETIDADQMGPIIDTVIGTGAQEVGALFLKLSSKPYIAFFSYTPNASPTANVTFGLIATAVLPSEEATVAEWFDNCKPFVDDPTKFVDVEANVEILDQGLKSPASTLVGGVSVGANRQFGRSEFLFDYTDYAADTEFYFEGIFTNASATRARSIFVWKMMRGRDASPRIVHTITIPPQVFKKRIRFSELFNGYKVDDLAIGVDPGVSEGLQAYEDAYQLEVEQEGEYTSVYGSPSALPNSEFAVHKLRLITYSVGGDRAVIDIPMSSKSVNTLITASEGDLGTSEFSTSSTSYTDVPNSSIWEYNASEWSTIDRLKFQATISQATAGSGFAALVDVGTSTVIAEVAVPVLTSAKAVGVEFDRSSLTSGHKYKVQVKSTTGSGTVHHYKSRLRVVINPVSKYKIYWRLASNITEENVESRIFYNPEINSHVASVQLEGIGASGSVALVNGVLNDGSQTKYPGWFGYIPTPGHPLDHIPAQNYTDTTNFATTADTFEEEKSNGTFTIDNGSQLIQEYTQAALQFEFISVVVGSSESAAGLVDINTLRDALISSVATSKAALIGALVDVLTFTTKDVKRVTVSNLIEGNRYWGYQQGSMIQTMLVYNIDTSVEDANAEIPPEPIATGDVLFRRAFKSPTDLIFIFNNQRYKIRELCFDCYFFNLMWEYSEKLNLRATLPAPDAPKIVVVSVLSYDINIRLDIPPDSLIDTVSVTIELSTNKDFVGKVTRLKGGPLQSVYSLHAVGGVGPVSDQYIRAKRTDYLGDSDWSDIVFVSSDALIGSTVLTTSPGTAGAIPTFTGDNNNIADSGISVIDGRITDVSNPTAPQDAATKEYVDVLFGSVSGGTSVSGNTKTLTVTFDGGGTVIAAGGQAAIPYIPWNGTIVGWAMTSVPATASGSIEIDFKTGPTHPAASSITGGNEPALTNQNYNEDFVLSGWSTSLTKSYKGLWVINGTPSGVYLVTLEFLVETS